MDPDPLAKLGRALREAGYAFVTPTPATHARVLARRGEARTLRDVFGWTLPFRREVLPARVLGLLEASGELEPGVAPLLLSRVRFSTVGPVLLRSEERRVGKE